MDQRPRSREKRVTDNSKGVSRRGEGLGTGPVGKGGPHAGGGRSGGGPSGGPGMNRSSGGGGNSPIGIIIGLIVVLLGGGGGAMALLGGGSDSGSTDQYSQETSSSYSQDYSSYGSTGGSSSASSYMSSLFGSSSGSTDSDWYTGDYTGVLNTEVAEGSRDKYTTIKGDGSDTTTIMVYMCGTDLESKNGMATNDLKEMAAATSSDQINIIVYTGGCKSWQLKGISNSVNQIYQLSDGKLKLLEKDMGKSAMTKPANLTEFIKYCKKNFPADRNDLILWDHGGGSVSGYGYDEKNASAGSMSLSGINKALSDAGMKFDFIGFDACLMATAENALMLNDYADYLIASEETEPGIGWYYTSWLTAYAKDPSMDTLTLGKNIVDGFISECNKSCKGQKTTLSVIDLAEFANTVPDALKAFSEDTVEMIQDNEYQQIATARQSAREFAQSSKIDQVDFVDLAKKLNTDASNALADVLLSAVKYNKTASTMTNSYGVSVYFPNKKLSMVDSAVSVNDAIGVDDEYSKCIKEYASLQLAGQTVATGNGNTGSAFPSLIGSMLSSSSGTAGSDLTTQLLQSLLTSGTSSISGLDGSSLDFFSGRSLSLEDTASYVADHQLDSSLLTWQESEDGGYKLTLPEDQWSLVTDLELNMFYDDGSGYIDLGYDNVFSFDDDGNLIPETDRTWIAINGQPVAYYYMDTTEDGDDYTITGYVPAMLNGERVKLLLTFDQDNPYGFIAGYETDYHDGETETVSKALSELNIGDELDFICDYYNYDGTYEDSYYLGDPMTVEEDMEISNVSVGDGNVLETYKFTDIYNQEYWSEALSL